MKDNPSVIYFIPVSESNPAEPFVMHEVQYVSKAQLIGKGNCGFSVKSEVGGWVVSIITSISVLNGTELYLNV